MAKAISKKERALKRLEANAEVFRCPICKSGMSSNGASGMRCTKKHSFDIARNGYLNLLVGTQNTDYGKDLFQSRRQVFLNSVYDPLIATVALFVRGLHLQNPFVLDAGCGEGSFLTGLERHLHGRFLGLDISRDGIRLAAAQDSSAMWCVADLAALPLQDACLDVILNILSPANYGEFRRVLNNQGVVVKVLPGKDYLKEIRLRLADVKFYSNHEVLSHLEANMHIQRSEQLHYQVPVSPEIWRHLVTMTPLTQHQEVIGGEHPDSLTIDLQVVQGTLGIS